MTDVLTTTRRRLLQVGGAAAALAAGLDRVAFAQGKTYQEAPALAKLVAAGKLPPVAKRLPDTPVVVEPLTSAGVYGGHIRTGIIQNRGFQARSAWGPEPILRIARDGGTIQPNLAESWSYSNDGKTFRLNLRKGIKWSDGAPFDARGFDFWWNHVNLNKQLSPSPSVQFMVKGKVPTFKVVDDLTVEWTFVAPHANLPALLAHALGATIPRWLPQHYLSQFHPDFVDEATLKKRVADAGFTSWVDLINNKSNGQWLMPFLNPDMPTLLPFRLQKPMAMNLMVADRNPYYWKVDPDGRQLPYIDDVIVTNFESAEVRDAAIAGTTFTNMPLYKENAQKGHYAVRLWKTSRAAEHTLMLNHTAKDPVLRALFGDIRFKQALSAAIDRQMIADTIYLGFGKPAQLQMIPGSRWRDDKLASRDTAFDKKRADALLDEVGLTKRDGKGIRLRSDGKPLTLNLDVPVDDPGSVAVGELLIEFLRDVGVTMNVRSLAREQVRALIDNNDMEFGIWIGDKCSDTMFPHSPEWHVPYLTTGWNVWGMAYAQWYESGGKRGEEPKGDAKRVQDLFDEMQITVDEARRLAIGKEILKLNADNLWNIGDVGEVPIPVILGDNYVNYPEEGVTSYDWLGNHHYLVEQTYFKGGAWSGERT
jgi:peptide/nickel transport system substrate-binding protein